MTPRSLTLAAAATLLTSGLAVAPALTSPASAAPTHGDKRVCAAAPTGYAACHARVRTLVTPDGKVRPDATTTRTSGYITTDLRTAYGLLGKDGTATVAVVDAYASPNAAADLAAYRSQTGLPALVAGQFVQYNQAGGSISTVPSDVGWGQEEMLDLEMVSAICPSCKIIYVGGTSASFADLGTAVDTAVAKGATVVSNSYGAAEFSGENTYAGHYNHPGVAITVSSGDNGFGVEAPAAFNTVTAVGGTHLVLTSSKTRSSETAWSGAGSGCSAVVTKPAWQQSTSYCSRRAVADVSAVADPNTGVAVYDSFGSSGGANWYVFGGTSVAAPIIGAIYGLSGSSTAGVPAQLSYTNRANLYDVTSGTNAKGRCRSGYLCQAGTGYDGPTGNGAPNGSLAPF
jgi:subtilase family serine protease